MKNRTTLSLIELTIMIMVFAVCASLCLRAFFAADETSRIGADRDAAVICTQSAAELVKACRGDGERVCEMLLASRSGNEITAFFDEDLKSTAESGKYKVKILIEESENKNLGAAGISTLGRKNEELFSLRVCWQEVGE